MSSSSVGKLFSRKNKRKTAKAAPTELLTKPKKRVGRSTETEEAAPKSEIVLSTDPANRRPARPAPAKPLVKRKGRVFDPAELPAMPDTGRAAPPSDAGRAAPPSDAGRPLPSRVKRIERTPVRPRLNRRIPDDTAKDLQDIAATAKAADVGSRLDDERTRLDRIGSSQSATEWAEATREFSEKVRAIKEVLPDVLGLIEELPLDRRDLIDLLMGVNGPASARGVKDIVRQEHAAAKKRCADAVAAIEPSLPHELQALSLVDKLELLTDLRGGGQYESQDRRKAAMAKLYLHIDLDPDFAIPDGNQRAVALDEIRTVLAPEDRDWAIMTQDERVDALRVALEIQSKHMGLPASEQATVRVGANMTRTLDDGSTVTLGGVFNPVTRTIEISSDRLGHFDTIMDTVIHENTHNHQRWLITQLEQGAIQPGHPYYRQVALFALNQGVGNHKGGTGLLPKKDDDDAYEKQPTELHAHLAGAEATRKMKENATARAADLTRRIDEWAAANPADRHAGMVPVLKNLLQQALTMSALGGSSTMIHAAVDSVEKNFSTLSTPAPVVAAHT
jgi:hypothetical protein